MADVTVQAQKPDVSLQEITLSGLDAPADNDGIVHPQILWQFNNTGGSSLTVKDIIWGVWIGGDGLPQNMPEGTRVDGNGIVITNKTNSLIGTQLPSN